MWPSPGADVAAGKPSPGADVEFGKPWHGAGVAAPPPVPAETCAEACPFGPAADVGLPAHAGAAGRNATGTENRDKGANKRR
jgi:hypothetical protein